MLFMLRWLGLPVLCLAIGFGGGWKVHDWKDASSVVKAATHILAVVQKSDASSQSVALKEQAAQIQIRTVTKTLIKEIPVEIPAAADTHMPVGWVRLHDAAALGVDLSQVPNPAGFADADPSPVTASQSAAAVVENYGTANSCRQELSDLQSWVKAQQAIYSSPP